MKALILILLSATAGAQETLNFTASSLAYTIIQPGATGFWETPIDLSGSLTLSSSLGANWNNQTVTPTVFNFGSLLDSSIMAAWFDTSTFSFSTDANAKITGWNIMLDNKIGFGARAHGEQEAWITNFGDNYFATSQYPDCGPPGASCSSTVSAVAEPGKWAVAAPEIGMSGVMGAMLMLGFGLAVLRGRKKVVL